jgi:hypothetical protein
MDFVLRPGESLTRYWEGQGRWRVDESWRGEGSLKQLRASPPGPKTASRISLNNSYGNGKWVYQPRLTDEYGDFDEGAYWSENVRLGADGVTLSQPGVGVVEWRVRTPYIIVGKPKDLADLSDDVGAATANFAAEGAVALSVSTDQGRTWQRAWSSRQERGQHEIDLTKWVLGKYEYHVRFELQGEPGTAVLRSLELTTWTQLAPMALPRLKAGVNRLRFLWGDRQGLPTEVMAVEPELSDAEDASRWGVKVDGEYNPGDRTLRARGPVTLRVDALKGTQIRWLHIGAAFNARRESGARVQDRMLYSLSPDEGWQVLSEETPPTWNQHWYYNMETDLVLDRPAASVWLRLEPATAANGLRVYAHCAAEKPEQKGPVVLTHAFRIDGKLRKRSFRFSSPTEYEISCDGEPENVYVQMAVPSAAK